MSDTPRTDKYNRHCAECHKVNGMTLIQHARQLERELQTAKDEGYNEGHNEGREATVAAMRGAYEPILEATAKDSERLDWILSDAGGFWLSTREDIDKEMEESL